MEKGEIKKLMEKYAAGHSTLEEEELLIKNSTDNESIETQWFKYVKGKKQNPKTGFNDKIWEAIKKKEKKRLTRKLIIGGMSIAASLLFLLFYLRPAPIPETKSLAEKEALLKEALAMFENNTIKTNNKKVLYEDEIIIIYSTSE
ncbi:hypothetical protein [Cyclobacterium qasimii]|uniref:Uncharacterized protein n=1 Tax=Cyclobacterium qasimii TaxID=1350429 RepID=A0A512C8J3_9BACT|nr:hypothetical protein [Cyclobacterium qasimii]GEO20528.1 hypothetical protein CQA01_10620 [Cyclobacterium qasimii]